MATVIAVIAIVAIGAYALRGTIKRAKGGGCHGGGPTITEPEKILEGEILGTKEFHVDGMHCENCKGRVEHVINAMDGASCKVDLKAKTAKVSYNKEIDFDEVKRRIEVLGYTVA